jgi:hypothetical protein
MQWLFIKHGIFPGMYYNLPVGEKTVLKALFEDYLENKDEV